MAEDVRLTVALLNHGQWESLRDGSVKPNGISMEISDTTQGPQIYRRMVREGAWDVGEVAITTFLCARSFNKPLSAIPVFTNRDVTMSEIVYNANSGIKSPKDLEGKRVGLRSFTVTNNTQARALLKLELGVNTDSIRWVVTEDAHVAEYRNPPNVQLAPEGKSLEDLLKAGEIDAAIQVRVKGDPNVRPLLTEEEADEVGLRYFRRTGVYPIGHVITVKDETLKANPWIGGELFRAFKASKDRYVESLDSRAEPNERDRQAMRNRELVGGDPMPFGLRRNRKSFEAMIQWSKDQRVIPTLLEADPMFAQGTRDID
jgi:4,5-dihydroxyphthalate decarboxylase